MALLPIWFLNTRLCRVGVCLRPYLGKHGYVTEVRGASGGDFIYRYMIRLADGRAATFFAFEFEIEES